MTPMSSGGVIVVAIDGPSGVGKSTVARGVAARMRLPFVETGAMYRALGWEIYRQGIDPDDQGRVEEVARGLDLELRLGDEGSVEILLGGRPLTTEVRLPRVSQITSQTSSYAAVRRRMVSLQRQFAEKHGAVMEGRDIGTRVFPDTPYKFFLDAPLEVRVARRVRQLEEAGRNDLSMAAIEAEVAERDRRDSQRQESPLSYDATYTVVDTGTLTAADAVEVIVAQIERFRLTLRGRR